MAAPNLISANTITGKTATANCTTVSSNVITVSANTVVKLNSIIFTNYNNSDVVSANAIINRSGTTYFLGAKVNVPPNSTLVLLGKDSPIYLEENDVLQTVVSANSAIHMSAGYELITI